MSAPRRPQRPTRAPYFLRAMHEWISDAGLTPQIIVDAHADGVHVPPGYSDQQGRIVLNLGLEAVRDLELGNEAVSFKARFGGAPYSIVVPIVAIQGVYARESGEGIVFNEELSGQTASDSAQAAPREAESKPEKPSLKIVK